MKKLLYAIHDDKLGAFAFPVTGRNDADMVRQFGDLIENAKDSIYSKHPEDFSLWYLGEYNDETGECLADCQLQRKLASGVDFVKKEA